MTWLERLLKVRDYLNNLNYIETKLKNKTNNFLLVVILFYIIGYVTNDILTHKEKQ